MDPDLEGCDVCGNKHATEDCPILALDELGDQQPVLSQTTQFPADFLTTEGLGRARMTAPGSVEILDQPDGTVQVITKQRFEPKQRLGPFEAKRTTQKIDIENGFILKIFGKDNSTVWLDTSDENNCNWLSLIRTADNTKNQNLMAVQLGTEIFFIVTKVVEPGTEMRVWYAPHYARKVGKQTEPDGKTKALLGQILVSLDNTVIAIGSDISPSKLQSIWRHSTGEKDAESLGLSWQTIQGLLSQGDSTQQTLTDTDTAEPPTWTILNKPIIPRIAYVKHKLNQPGMRSCRHCDAQFETLEALAKHVKEHLRASVQDSKLRFKEEQTTPPKRKRGRPKKKPVEEVDSQNFSVPAQYISHDEDGLRIVEQSDVTESIQVMEVHQDTTEMTDGNVTPAVLNISGEGYRIVVKGTDANGENISEVQLQRAECVGGDPADQNFLPVSLAEQADDISTVKDQVDLPVFTLPSSQPHIVDVDVKSGDLVSAPKRQRLETTRRTSRRGVRGTLSKHCTMVLDDTKRFTYKCNHCRQTFLKLELFSRHLDSKHNGLKDAPSETLLMNTSEQPQDIVEPTVQGPLETVVAESAMEVDHTTPVEGEKADGEGANDENEQIFKCPKCDKSFEKLKYLNRHLRGHSDSHLCRKCGKRFVRKETLEKHTCIQKKVGPLDEEEKTLYHCEFCGVSFAKQNYLLRHMATHTGEFRCKHCSRIFSRKESMLQHIKKYHPEGINSTDEIVFPCDQCHRVFSREVTLQNHQKLHEGAHRCEQCGRCFASVFNLEKHTCGVIVAHKNGFQCQQCQKVFQTESAAQHHLPSHALDLSCSICKSTFSHRNALNQHMVVCSAALQGVDSGSFQCTVCDASFPDAGSFKAHYKEHSHPYQCDRCEKLFIRVSNMRKHKCTGPVALGPNKVSCEICSRTFSHERFLQRHMTVHNPPKYECETCGSKFTRIDFYNKHMCISETGERVQIERNLKKDDLFGLTHAICPTCGKSYSSVSNLNKHMKTHGDKTETCDVCGKQFHLKIALREHMRSVHTEEYKYTCQYCGKSMKCRNSLFGHVRQFHSQTIIMYECEQCGKQFRQKGNLKKHALTHSSQRTFECKDCDRKFKFPDQLKRHEIWHTHGERFVCEFCCKKFVMQFELRKHLQRYHSGLMYVCRYCNTECRHSHTMKRHLQHRHSHQLEWQQDPTAYIKQLVPQHRINNMDDKDMDTADINTAVTDEVIHMADDTAVISVKDTVDVTEETAETSLLDNAMLAAQLQAQIQDPTLPLDSQPFIVAEVSGLANDDPDTTQTVIIQTSAGHQFDTELMSQEVAAALQSLTKQGGSDTFTIIQNLPLGDQPADLQQVPDTIGADQPFVILPMVTEAGNVTEPATGFEATAHITTIPDGITTVPDIVTTAPDGV